MHLFVGILFAESDGSGFKIQLLAQQIPNILCSKRSINRCRNKILDKNTQSFPLQYLLEHLCWDTIQAMLGQRQNLRFLCIFQFLQGERKQAEIRSEQSAEKA